MTHSDPVVKDNTGKLTVKEVYGNIVQTCMVDQRKFI